MREWINNKELINNYDVVHVDGGHSDHCISNDMINADLLVKKDGIIIIDDTNCESINNYADLYLFNGNYMELELFPTIGHQYRVIKK